MMSERERWLAGHITDDEYNMPAGYYMQCGGCDAEMFVTEAQWSDTGLRVIEHVGCAHQGGVDLDHARRHSD